MSDDELDRLLDLWEAPTPRRSLRDDLRARFPQRERLGFTRPLRWAVAVVLMSVALAIALAGAVAVAQNSDTISDLPIVRLLNQLYQNWAEAREARQAKSIQSKVRESEPMVYVDGRLTAPLEFGGGAQMIVHVPGEEGVYSITAFRFRGELNAVGRPTGWVEAGHIHGSVIEFRAGSKQVRIECNQPIVDIDRPVFVMHRPRP